MKRTPLAVFKALFAYNDYMAGAQARARAVYDLPSAVPTGPRVTTSQCAAKAERIENDRRNRAMDAMGWT